MWKTDLSDIKYEFPLSMKKIVIVAPNKPATITLHKYLAKVGFETIYNCREFNEGKKIFLDLIKNKINATIIIDSRSENSIENVTREILNISTGANIVIITEKEETDPQIVKLFDIGITATLRYPLRFEDLRKFADNLIEKKKNMKTTEIKEKLDTIQIPPISIEKTMPGKEKLIYYPKKMLPNHPYSITWDGEELVLVKSGDGTEVLVYQEIKEENNYG